MVVDSGFDGGKVEVRGEQEHGPGHGLSGVEIGVGALAWVARRKVEIAVFVFDQRWSKGPHGDFFV
jgi:hypothetical protein